MMKLVLLAVAAFSVSSLAFAAVPVPEIDGALFIQFAALAVGLAVLIKKKKR